MLSFLTLLTIVINYPYRPSQYYNSYTKFCFVPNILDIGYSPNKSSMIAVLGSIPNEFYIYSGASKKLLQNISLTDATQKTINPSCHAFSDNENLIVIGTK